MVTLTITSCDRLDLLNKTLRSFKKFNTYPISEIIIRDDSLADLTAKLVNLVEKIKFNCNVRILDEGKIGQLGSIDKMYSCVKTPYIFHCEDDWGFYKEGFIEDSMTILKAKPEILQVWIRPKSDRVAHNHEEEIFKIKDVKYRLVQTQRAMNGFSFNPHLCRLKDYSNYAEIGKECEIGKYYLDKGFRTAWLLDGYVKHIGQGRTCTRNQKWRG